MSADDIALIVIAAGVSIWAASLGVAFVITMWRDR